MQTVSGEIKTVIFENADNGYKVVEIETEDDLFVAVGYMHGAAEGETVKLTGKWVSHHTYGEQFAVEMYEKQMPTSKASIVKYLGSGIIKGVRAATAQKIVDAFGEDALTVIEKEPLRLTQIRGISAEKAMAINLSYITQIGASSLMIFLQQYDISVKLCAKIYKRFGGGAVELIKSNPYILCDEIEGIGFKTADKMAISMGINADDANRIRSGVLYTHLNNTLFGHTYLPREILAKLASDLLGVSIPVVNEAISSLTVQRRFISEDSPDGERIYYFTHYHAEKYCARRINEITANRYEIDENEIMREIGIIEAHRGIKLAHMQKTAVQSAMENSALVITGGPGTGKTTIINTIIDIMHANGLKVVLTAPTGRAAKRMSQVCGKEAKTIHRLLEAGYSDGESDLMFQVDESNPIEADVIIVDEMSMVDILLMSALLRAIAAGTRIIMVGDVDQLPSVGAGDVLRHIIESGVVPVIRLTEIFRQAEESMIVVNAHKINGGEYPVCNSENTDFFYANLPSATDGAEYITSLCLDKLPQKYGISSADIQVLSPSKKGIAGVINLNTLLQQALNPAEDGKPEKSNGNVTFRVGDRVMQTKNNYDLQWYDVKTLEEGTGVFNGDVGYIQDINQMLKTVAVVFEDRRVTYNFKDLDELDLAYAATVHKSQGSEFPVVIVPVYDAPYMLVSRNLLYTAVTRAKNLVVLVGREDIIRKMVDNNRTVMRYSSLKEKLTEVNADA
ncbi:MAG: ATP-dependent RecD-like DNA helicase [Clostridia bacterium]|nr:ATP-dependent RecD-like DNA helicase [Clostridia bacterium]